MLIRWLDDAQVLHLALHIDEQMVRWSDVQMVGWSNVPDVRV